MQDIKTKIKTIVSQYKKSFSEEYKVFKKQIKPQINADDYQEMAGADFIQRKVLEYPESLHILFTDFLEEDGKRYLESKEGIRWFARTFPEFRVTKKV